MGRTEIPDLSGLQGEPWLVGTVFFQLERNGAFSKADAEVRSKKNLTPPTLSEKLINLLRQESVAQFGMCFGVFFCGPLPLQSGGSKVIEFPNQFKRWYQRG